MRKIVLGLIAALVSAQTLVQAQGQDAFGRILKIANNYQVVSNVTYLTASNWDSKLDIYRPRGAASPTPTLVFFHGGGWTTGAKEGAVFSLLPYLDLGWSVVNVEYRTTAVALAPAAVEDARCALRWIYRNAKQYNFDVSRVVVTGQSAGGHLALMTGLLDDSAGFDRLCPGDRGTGPRSTEEMKVAAILNWYGITEVAEMLSGPNTRSYAVAWFGSMPNRVELAKQLSPLTYVRAGAPPILTVQGDADPTVPYTQGVRLHEALTKARVPNQHVTIPGGKHGGFSDAEMAIAYTAIRSFLDKHVLKEKTTTN